MENLPKIMISYILEFLDYKDIINTISICKKFYALKKFIYFINIINKKYNLYINKYLEYTGLDNRSIVKPTIWFRKTPTYINLNHITVIDFYNCGIKEVNKFPSMPYVRFLSLENNYIKKISNFQDIFAGLPLLTELNLSYNNIREISAENIILGNFADLRCLNLKNNKIKYLCNFQEIFGIFPALIELNLSENKLSIISESESNTILYNLRDLNLSQNRLSALPNFKSCRNIRYLNCSNNNILNILNVKTLTYLDISFNQIKTLKINMPELYYLSVNNNLIDMIDNTSKFTKVKTLDIRYNYIRYIPDKFNFPSLFYLYISHNFINKLNKNKMPVVRYIDITNI